MDVAFPLPFEPLSTIDGSVRGGAGKFLVGAMYTAGYAALAERLRLSCEQFGVPHVLHEVPSVHNSMSVKGSPDLRYTKANYIRHLLDRYRRPILFLDVDCVFRAYPALIDEMVDDGTTFAVYNWAADTDNEAFYPIDVRLNGRLIEDRFFKYSHRVKWHSTQQLISSVCVHLFDASPAAAALLGQWHWVISEHPGVVDDHCLDHAFNNGGAGLPDARWRWLPKEYARYCWWIHARPVIDHPQYPATGAGFKSLPAGLRQRFYPERCVRTEPRFSPNAVIDVQDRALYEFAEGKLSLVRRLDLEFWIPEGRFTAGTIDVTSIGAA